MSIFRTFSSAASRPFFTPPIEGVNGSNYWEKVATFPSEISGWRYIWVGNENRVLYAQKAGDSENKTWEWVLNNGIYTGNVTSLISQYGNSGYSDSQNSQIGSNGDTAVNLNWVLGTANKSIQFLKGPAGQYVLDGQQSVTTQASSGGFPSYDISSNSKSVALLYHPGNYIFELRVYRKIGANWVETTRQTSPPKTVVSISGDGNTIAFRGEFSGDYFWYLYKWKGTITTKLLADDWTLIKTFNFGYAPGNVFLNEDGTRVFSAEALYTGAEPPIYVQTYRMNYRAYEFDGTNWNQMGSTITAPNTTYLSGAPEPRGRLINRAGNIMVIRSDQSPTLRSILAYKWNGASWNLMGSPIQAENLGSAIFVNEAGNRVTIAKDNGYGPPEQYLYIP